METSSQFDPDFGFEYKEFWMEVSLDGEAYDDEESRNTELRVLSLNEQYATTVFSIECLTEDGTVAAKYERDQLVGLHGTNGTYEHMISNPDNPLCIVSYVGPDPQNPLSGRGEPYTLYNTDGLITSRGSTETALLLEGLGATLQPGDYSYSFEQATKYSLGVNKVLYQVMDGEEELAQLLVTKAMVDATVGSDADIFETRSVPFTIDDSRAGHEITVRISLYGGTDYRLQSVSLNLVVDANESAPAEPQAVIDAIHALEIDDIEGTAAARAAYDALDALGKAWVGSELANRLATYENAQSDAAAVAAAINALGSKEEVNETNYAEKTEGLEAAEALYKKLSDTYGAENVAKLVDAQPLADYRTAYDAAKALADRTAAVKAVEDLITAIGEVTEDNYAAKEALIKTAEEALAKLEIDYSAETAALVSNKADLAAARTKFDEYNSMPDVTFGDINSDGKIDASDALLALQHSVKLITLSETEALAADVTADNQINASDALMILQCSVQLISTEDFPAAKQQ